MLFNIILKDLTKFDYFKDIIKIIGLNYRFYCKKICEEDYLINNIP